MSDLISRQEAISALSILADKMTEEGAVVMEQAIAMLRDLYPAEPERKIGEWIEWQAPNGIDCGIKCSICGYKANTYPGYGSAYCPTCGARME